jgi:outer membrane protein
VRRIILAAGIFGALLSASQAADVKVGFVNVAKVLEDAPQAEEARTKLETEFSPRDRELVAGQREIRQLEDRLQREGPKMSEAERVGIEQEIRQRKRDIKRQGDEFREDLNLRRNQELAALQRLVLDTIQSLAKKESYDLVLTDGVVFASGRVDITSRVLEQLKQAGVRRPASE